MKNMNKMNKSTIRYIDECTECSNEMLLYEIEKEEKQMGVCSVCGSTVARTYENEKKITKLIEKGYGSCYLVHPKQESKTLILARKVSLEEAEEMIQRIEQEGYDQEESYLYLLQEKEEKVRKVWGLGLPA